MLGAKPGLSSEGEMDFEEVAAWVAASLRAAISPILFLHLFTIHTHHAVVFSLSIHHAYLARKPHNHSSSLFAWLSVDVEDVRLAMCCGAWRPGFLPCFLSSSALLLFPCIFVDFFPCVCISYHIITLHHYSICSLDIII